MAFFGVGDVASISPGKRLAIAIVAAIWVTITVASGCLQANPGSLLGALASGGIAFAAPIALYGLWLLRNASHRLVEDERGVEIAVQPMR